MHHGRNIWLFALLVVLWFSGLTVFPADSPMQVRVGTEGQLIVNGRDVFPIGFTTGPPTGAKAPNGNNGFAELAKNGFVFFQWLSEGRPWDSAAEAEADSLLREANRNGIKVALSVEALHVIRPDDEQKRAQLEGMIRRYRDNPAIFLWRGSDEPALGRIPPENLKVFYDTVHSLDPHHPVWITQAALVRGVRSREGLISALRPYTKYYDVGAIDNYTIAYPPRTFSIPNNNISSVGDYTSAIRDVDGNQKGLMMTLQICWSGVWKPGNTLRFPTFPEERYMSYQAIIEGAHALLYFGGDIENCLSDEDRSFGWNWRFYRRVLEPVLEEFRPQSPLYPALIAPNSSLPIRVEGGTGLEFTVRDADDYIYILAAKREGDTAQFTFSGLPQSAGEGEVLFESPRHVRVEGGKFTDWFGPNEVHVYRFRRISH